MAIRKSVLLYKQFFYKLVVETHEYKTRTTIEKFFFNSRLTQVKALWIVKLMYEKEKLKIPEKTVVFLRKVMKVVEYIKIKREREAFNRIDLDKYYMEKFREIVTKQKIKSSEKFKEFSRSYLHKQKFSKHVQLLFSMEKLTNKKINEHFQHFKRMTLKKYNEIFKAGHYILKQIKRRYQ